MANTALLGDFLMCVRQAGDGLDGNKSSTKRAEGENEDEKEQMAPLLVKYYGYKIVVGTQLVFVPVIR